MTSLLDFCLLSVRSDISLVSVTPSDPLRGLFFPATKTLHVQIICHLMTDLGLPGKSTSPKMMHVKTVVEKKIHHIMRTKAMLFPAKWISLFFFFLEDNTILENEMLVQHHFGKKSIQNVSKASEIVCGSLRTWVQLLDWASTPSYP